MIIKYILCVLMAYAIGCSSMALYIAKFHKVNLRTSGSGNLGASNAMVTMGWKAGIIVAVHDIAKAAVAVVLAGLLFPALPYAKVVAGVACVLGHIFPFYLKFKGGKGLASYLGMTLAINWKLALFVAIVLVLVTLITDYIVLGTVSTVIIVPLFYVLINASLIIALILSVASLVMLLKHTDNYRRILAGTEIGFRRANRGDDRQI